MIYSIKLPLTWWNLNPSVQLSGEATVKQPVAAVLSLLNALPLQLHRAGGRPHGRQTHNSEGSQVHTKSSEQFGV